MNNSTEKTLKQKNSTKIIQIPWIIGTTLTSAWFLYWIIYEAIIWNKYLMDATPLNYIALTASITLLIIGTQLQRIITKNKQKQNAKTNCKYYLGYLSKHPKHIQTPDECLTCHLIVDCTKQKEQILNH